MTTTLTQGGNVSKIIVQTKDQENSSAGLTEDVSEKLVKLFNKSSLSTGSFLNDQDSSALQPKFAELLDQYYKNGEYSDFVAFTSYLTNVFASIHLDKAKSAPGGYLVFYHAVRGDEHFLSVVLLRMATGMTLSEDLEFNENEQLDLEHLHLAARINITDWKEGLHPRYIAFKVGRSAKEMRDYFSDFIGCKEFTEAKEDTRGLIASIKLCCKELGYSAEKTGEIRGLAYNYCQERREAQAPVELELIGRHLFSEKPEVFVGIAQKEPYNLNEKIDIDARELRSFVRYSGRTKKLSISFEHELLGNEVLLNEDDSLTLRKPPPKLLLQLKNKDY